MNNHKGKNMKETKQAIKVSTSVAERIAVSVMMLAAVVFGGALLAGMLLIRFEPTKEIAVAPPPPDIVNVIYRGTVIDTIEAYELGAQTVSEIEQEKVVESGGRYFASFQQKYNGVPVYGGRMTALIKDGETVYINSRYQSGVDVLTSPKISITTAVTKAKDDLINKSLTMSLQKSLDLVDDEDFLPAYTYNDFQGEKKEYDYSVITEEGVNLLDAGGELVVFPFKDLYNLVWKVDFPLIREIPAQFTYFVDAHNGEVLDIRNNLLFYDVSGTVTGMEWEDPFTDGIQLEKPFKNNYINIGASQQTTDESGNYLFTGLSSTQILSSYLEGPWVKVENAQQAESYHQATVSSAIIHSWNWLDLIQDTWIKTGNLDAAISINSLVEHNGVLYAGTYPNGDVFKLEENGTWTNTGAMDGVSSVHSLAEHNGVLYAGTYPNGDVFKLEENGTWTNTGDLDGAEWVNSFIEHNCALYAGTRPNGDVFKLEENGTWTNTGDLDGVSSVHSLAEHNSILYAGTYPSGNVFKSEDDGATWTNTDELPGIANINSLVEYNGALYAGTNNGNVFKLEENGTWTNTGDLDGASYVFSLVEYNGVLYAGTGYNGDVFKLEEDNTWTNTGKLGGVTNINSLVEHNGVLYAGTYPNGDVFKSEGNTDDTLVQTGDLEVASHVYSFIKHNGALYAGTGPNGDVFKSEDDGATWTNTGDLDGASYVFSLAEHNGVLYAGTSPNGDVFEYDEFANTWTNTGNLTDADRVNSLAEHNGALYAGTESNGDVFKLEENGTWTNTGDLDGAAYIYTLIEHNCILYAGTNNGDVFKSEDDGATWTNTGDLDGASNVFSFIKHNGALYAGTGPNGDVFKSEDDGATWTNTGDLDGAAYIYSLAEHNGVLYAGTNNGDVFKSEDNGATWTNMGELGGVSGVYSLAELDGALYAGTYSSGDVFKTKLKIDSSYKQVESNAFYHVNRIHDFAVSLGAGEMNFQMPTEVNINAVCNAYYTPDDPSIIFSKRGQCESTALISDIIYHEYGHGISRKLNPSFGSYSGQSGTLEEGIADYWACTLNDNPDFAEGFFIGSANPLRVCNSTEWYPKDFGDEPHKGMGIITGSLWDMRNIMGAASVDQLLADALRLEPINFIGFEEALLAVDDNDGDLSNGTPNIMTICNSFLTHGISSDCCVYTNTCEEGGGACIGQQFECNSYPDLTGYYEVHGPNYYCTQPDSKCCIPETSVHD